MGFAENERFLSYDMLKEYTKDISDKLKGRMEYKEELPIYPTGTTTRTDWNDIILYNNPSLIGDVYKLSGTSGQSVTIGNVTYMVGDYIIVTNEVDADETGTLSADITVMQLGGSVDADKKTILNTDDAGQYAKLHTRIGGWLEKGTETVGTNMLDGLTPSISKEPSGDITAYYGNIPTQTILPTDESDYIVLNITFSDGTECIGSATFYSKSSTRKIYRYLSGATGNIGTGMVFVDNDSTISVMVLMDPSMTTQPTVLTQSAIVHKASTTIHPLKSEYIQLDDVTMYNDTSDTTLETGALTSRSILWDDEIDSDKVFSNKKFIYGLTNSKSIDYVNYAPGVYYYDRFNSAWTRLPASRWEDKLDNQTITAWTDEAGPSKYGFIHTYFDGFKSYYDIDFAKDSRIDYTYDYNPNTRVAELCFTTTFDIDLTKIKSGAIVDIRFGDGYATSSFIDSYDGTSWMNGTVVSKNSVTVWLHDNAAASFYHFAVISNHSRDFVGGLNYTSTYSENYHTVNNKFINNDNITIYESSKTNSIDGRKYLGAKSALEITSFPEFDDALTETVYRLTEPYTDPTTKKEYLAGIYVCDKTDTANPKWIDISGAAPDELTIRSRDIDDSLLGGRGYLRTAVNGYRHITQELQAITGEFTFKKVEIIDDIMALTTDYFTMDAAFVAKLKATVSCNNIKITDGTNNAQIDFLEYHYSDEGSWDEETGLVERVYWPEKNWENTIYSAIELHGDLNDETKSYAVFLCADTSITTLPWDLTKTVATSSDLKLYENAIRHITGEFLPIDDTTVTLHQFTDAYDTNYLQAHSIIDTWELPDYTQDDVDIVERMIYRSQTETVIGSETYPAGVYTYDPDNELWVAFTSDTEVDEKTIRSTDDSGTETPLYTQIGGYKEIISKTTTGTSQAIKISTTPFANIITDDTADIIINNFDNISEIILNLNNLNYTLTKTSDTQFKYTYGPFSFYINKASQAILYCEDTSSASTMSYPGYLIVTTKENSISYVDNDYIAIDSNSIYTGADTNKTLHAKSAIEITEFPTSNILTETIYRLTADYETGGITYKAGLYVAEWGGMGYNWVSIGGATVDEKTIRTTDDTGTSVPAYTQIGGYYSNNSTKKELEMNDLGNTLTLDEDGEGSFEHTSKNYDYDTFTLTDVSFDATTDPWTLVTSSVVKSKDSITGKMLLSFDMSNDGLEYHFELTVDLKNNSTISVTSNDVLSTTFNTVSIKYTGKEISFADSNFLNIDSSLMVTNGQLGVHVNNNVGLLNTSTGLVIMAGDGLGFNDTGALIVNPGNGITIDEENNAVAIKLADKSLDTDSTGIKVNLATTSGLITDATNGLMINLPVDPSYAKSSTGILGLNSSDNSINAYVTTIFLTGSWVEPVSSTAVAQVFGLGLRGGNGITVHNIAYTGSSAGIHIKLNDTTDSASDSGLLVNSNGLYVKHNILYGTTEPTSSQGKDGDIYVLYST